MICMAIFWPNRSTNGWWAACRCCRAMSIKCGAEGIRVQRRETLTLFCLRVNVFQFHVSRISVSAQSLFISSLSRQFPARQSASRLSFVGDFSSPVMLVDGVGAGVEQAVDRVLLVLLLLGNLRLHHIYHTCGCQCFRRIKRLCSFLPLFLSFFTQLLQYTDTLILDGGPELEDKYSIFQQKKFAKIQRIKQFMNGFHILRYMCLYGVICCYFVLSFISYLKIF